VLLESGKYLASTDWVACCDWQCRGQQVPLTRGGGKYMKLWK
jgi:hypothetical protein